MLPLSHIKESIQWDFTLPKNNYWCDWDLDLIQDMACFLSELHRREACSSNNWNSPEANTVRSSAASIAFVKGSANWRDVGIHLKTLCSPHLSRMSRTSKVVRYSSQDGMANLVTRSYKLFTGSYNDGNRKLFQTHNRITPIEIGNH